MTETTATNYTAISDQIKELKASIVAQLATLHGEFAGLAELDRQLEAERLKSVEWVKGIQVINTPEMSAAIAEHAAQVKFPGVAVWSKIDDAISTIYQNTADARNELPELFARGNRIEDLTKGMR